MPGDSPLEGAEEPPLGASLALLSRDGPCSQKPQHLQSKPGWDGRWLFKCWFIRSCMRISEPPWTAMGGIACTCTAAGDGNPALCSERHWPLQTQPHCPGSRSCCAVLGKAQSAARGAELRPSRALYGLGVISVSTTPLETSFSWSYNPGY